MPESDATAAVAAEAAHTIREAARSHKRLAAHHRREAQTLMQRLADLRTQCAKAGIHIEDDRA